MMLVTGLEPLGAVRALRGRFHGGNRYLVGSESSEVSKKSVWGKRSAVGCEPGADFLERRFG